MLFVFVCIPTHLIQGKTALNFLYAKPPGMAEAEAAQQAAAGDDEAVKEFYRKYVFVLPFVCFCRRRWCVCGTRWWDPAAQPRDKNNTGLQ